MKTRDGASGVVNPSHSLRFFRPIDPAETCFLLGDADNKEARGDVAIHNSNLSGLPSFLPSFDDAPYLRPAVPRRGGYQENTGRPIHASFRVERRAARGHAKAARALSVQTFRRSSRGAILRRLEGARARAKPAWRNRFFWHPGLLSTKMGDWAR